MIYILGVDKHPHNLPTASEVAMIIPDEYDKVSRRDIILAHRNTGQQPLQFIDASNAAYLPLHYIIYFPFGELGWHYALRLQCGKRLSQRQFYQFHLHTRQLEPSTLFYRRRLLQQLVVNGFAVVDQPKLDWIRYNQSKICADLYNGLADVLIQDECNCYGDTSNILILNYIKIIDTYNTS